MSCVVLYRGVYKVFPDLYTQTDGVFYVLFSFFCAWFTDGFALFAGMALGKHKLAPKISPKKTVEGAVGGVIGCIGTCVALYFAFPKQKQIVPYAFLWLAVLLIAVMIFELLLIDWSDAWTEYQLFLVILAIPLAVSVLCGGIPATFLYRRDMKKEREAREKAPERPSYYNT